MPHFSRFALIAVCSMVGVLSGDPKAAEACGIVPTTEPRAWDWDVYKTVYIARIEGLHNYDAPDHLGRRGVLVPVDILKGSGPVPRVAIETRPVQTSCDSQPPALGPEASNGDLFVVYSSVPGPSVTANVYMHRVEATDDERILSRLAIVSVKDSLDGGPGTELGWLGLLGLAGLLSLRKSRTRPDPQQEQLE